MRKRNRGQDLELSAQDWNRLVDMANGGIGQTAGVGAKRNPNCVWVKNTLGRDLDRYAAVCIGSPTPVELHTGKNDQVFLLVNGSVAGRESVAAPSVDPVLGILAEPIANDRLGLVQIAGVTPARFRHTEALVVASYIPPSATISDLDDALVFSQFGSVRVMHRNLSVHSTWSAGQYFWVELGSESSLGSIYYRAQPATVTTFDSTGYADVLWYQSKGDARSIGAHGASAPSVQKGLLSLRRQGRFQVTVRWQCNVASPGGGYAAGDRSEIQVQWPAVNYDGSDALEYFSAGHNAWLSSGTPISFSGQRSFVVYKDTSVSSTIVLPNITGLKIARSDGATTSLTVSGGLIEVDVIRLGSAAANTLWSKTLADTAMGRGAAVGPI